MSVLERVDCTTHLTPKQHAKLVKLVGEKCNVKCKLNNVELLCFVGHWRSNKSIKYNTVKEVFWGHENSEYKSSTGRCH